MKYIANILTDKKFDNNILYNIVSSKDDLIENIPTLVIGWEFTKKNFPEVNILEWEINDNLFWTYGNREKRDRYEEKIVKFKDIAISKFIKSISYHFISVFRDKIEEPLLLYILKNKFNLNIYINNDMVYITNKISNIVYGFSLKEYEYIGYNKKEILNKIFKSENNIIDIKDSLSWELKSTFKNCNYIIPCLF